MALSAIQLKLVEGFKFLVRQVGREIVLRNPIRRISDREQDWYIINEEFQEYRVLALPLSAGEGFSAYSYETAATRVGAGKMEFAFIKGDLNASVETYVLWDGRTRRVEEVRGALNFEGVPLIQHVVVSL